MREYLACLLGFLASDFLLDLVFCRVCMGFSSRFSSAVRRIFAGFYLQGYMWFSFLKERSLD